MRITRRDGPMIRSSDSRMLAEVADRALRNAGADGGVGDRQATRRSTRGSNGLGIQIARSERKTLDAVGLEHRFGYVLPREPGGPGRRHLHLVVDRARPHVERAAEMNGKPRTLFTWFG